MLDAISQFSIAAFGILAILLVAKKNKWGFVLGLVSQPFWFITAVANHQWGVIAISIAATFSWAYGIYNWFWKSNQENK